MVKDDEDYTHVFFMGVGSSDSKNESDVRFRHELIHKQLIGEIMDSNSEHFSEPPNHLSIEAPGEAFSVRNDIPNTLTRRTHCPIREIR